MSNKFPHQTNNSIIILLLCGVSELTKQQLSCHTAMTEMVGCDFTASSRSMYMMLIHEFSCIRTLDYNECE